QFIKAAMVSRAIRESSDITETVVHTGQHFDANMSEVFFQELQMARPAHNLGIGGGSHASNTGRMLEAIETVIRQEQPAAVLVYGDTDSTLAGALAAAKLCIPVVHVEAGLRSYNMRMPEEINRRLTDHASTLLLAPNDNAASILRSEGLDPGCIHNIGDVMFDAALHFGALAKQRSLVLERLQLNEAGYVLATIHRQENTDDRGRLARLTQALGASAWPVVLPLHPRTRNRLADFGIAIPAGVVVTEPLGYLDMAMLEKHARLVATDSGGVQKEAYFHGVPCLTLRTETEWTELVEMGWNHLVSPDSDELAQAFGKEYSQGRPGPSPYGDGNAAGKALQAIRAAFCTRRPAA
ncbi:MAG: hypothetical protein JWP36_324, partial [Paucimonas sp.]|nr:hypothetical protein [Paucimonas sp.]